MQISTTLASTESLETYTQLSSHPLHSSSKPGILSIDIHQSKVFTFPLLKCIVFLFIAICTILLSPCLGCMDVNFNLICVLHFQDLILSGGVDATATVFNRSSGELLATLSGHTKRVRVFIWCSLLLLLSWLAILQWTFYVCIEFRLKWEMLIYVEVLLSGQICMHTSFHEASADVYSCQFVGPEEGDLKTYIWFDLLWVDIFAGH